jgi:predicted transcriptional regulator
MEALDFGVFKEFGIVGVGLYIAYQTITKLYKDMREDATKREESLMALIDTQSKTMTEISTTLKTLDGRVCNIERQKEGNNGKI